MWGEVRFVPHLEMVNKVALQVCGKPIDQDHETCHSASNKSNELCKNHEECRIYEKSEEQLSYVLSSIAEPIFLSACPGSGKTEVVGLKAAYEISKWNRHPGGIAVLTFTNNAAEVIKKRLAQFLGHENSNYPHFIGTFDSWVHKYIVNPFGHHVTGYEGKDRDKSIRLVDEDSRSGFLHSFESKPINRIGKITANRISYDPEMDELLINRQKYELEKWQYDNLWEVKCDFLRHGFCTHNDVTILAHDILDEDSYCSDLLAKRFPLIIVDECQDLSWMQMELLSEFKKRGTSIQFVGDLNQTIYEFNKIFPEKILDFVKTHDFSEKNLTINFRSVQDIVNLNLKIIGSDIPIKSMCKARPNPSLLVFKYKTKNDISKLPGAYEKLLIEFGIPINKSVILSNTNANISKLKGEPYKEANLYQEWLAQAIFHYSNNSGQNNKISLRLFGKFVSNKIFLKDRAMLQDKFYCPETIDSGKSWRIFLFQCLNAIVHIEDILDFDKDWSSWIALAKAILPDVLNKYKHIIGIEGALATDQLKGMKMKAPRNRSNEKLSAYLTHNQINHAKIDITTVHKAKGKTCDSVMLVSKFERKMDDKGYWETWLTHEGDEKTRFGYVASSRPKYLLVWAIPQKKDVDYSILEELGFEIIDI